MKLMIVIETVIEIVENFAGVSGPEPRRSTITVLISSKQTCLFQDMMCSLFTLPRYLQDFSFRADWETSEIEEWETTFSHLHYKTVEMQCFFYIRSFIVFIRAILFLQVILPKISFQIDYCVLTSQH